MIAVTHFQIFLFVALAIFLILSYLIYMLIKWDEQPLPSTLKNEEGDLPFSTLKKVKVVDFLVDPDFKLLCIFVSSDAIKYDHFVLGSVTFTETSQNDSHIKLIRSGTGFRVYNHPTVKEGQWLPCR